MSKHVDILIDMHNGEAIAMSEDERNDIAWMLIDLEHATNAFPYMARRLGKLWWRASTVSSAYRVARLIVAWHTERVGCTDGCYVSRTWRRP